MNNNETETDLDFDIRTLFEIVNKQSIQIETLTNKVEELQNQINNVDDKVDDVKDKVLLNEDKFDDEIIRIEDKFDNWIDDIDDRCIKEIVRIDDIDDRCNINDGEIIYLKDEIVRIDGINDTELKKLFEMNIPKLDGISLSGISKIKKLEDTLEKLIDNIDGNTMLRNKKEEEQDIEIKRNTRFINLLTSSNPNSLIRILRSDLPGYINEPSYIAAKQNHLKMLKKINKLFDEKKE